MIIRLIISTVLLAGLCRASVVDDMVSLLASAPAWSNLSEVTIKTEGPKLSDACRQISEKDPSVVREVIRAYWREYVTAEAGLAPRSKVYVFNRYYFNMLKLPSSAPAFGGGWIRAESDGDSPFWPWVLGAEDMELAHVMVAHTGPLHRGLDEFEFMYETVQRRVVGIVGPDGFPSIYPANAP